MPKINPNKCYNLTENKNLAADKTLEIETQARIIAKYTNNDDTQMDERDVTTRLNSIVGAGSTYTYKEELINALLKIQYHLKKTDINDTEKKLIADKLAEGLPFCFPGFHDRANIILTSLIRPKSIDELLSLMRFHIIDSTARRANAKVHDNNSFFLAAAAHGYGVRAINKNDIHSRALEEHEIAAVKASFETLYTSLAILAQLPLQIEQELRTYYGYVGVEDKGYKLKDYENIHGFLNTLLPNDATLTRFNLTLENLFLFDDESKLYDLNWTAIRQKLWSFLKKEGYLISTRNESILLEALFQKEDTVFINLLKSKRYVKLMHSFELMNYPEFFNYLSDAKKESIIDLFLNELPKNKTMLYNKLMTIQNFFSTSIAKEHSIFLVEKWFAVEENTTLIKQLKANDLDKQITLILQYLPWTLLKEMIDNSMELYSQLLFHAGEYPPLLNNLLENMSSRPLEQQLKMIHTRNKENMNLLMKIARSSGASLTLLIKKIMEFPQEEQINLITSKLDDGINTLMIAIARSVETASALLTLVSTFPLKEQVKIIKAVHSHQANALMVAARHQLLALPLILNIIATFSLEEQSQILQNTNATKLNALMIAAKEQPEGLESLLNRISALEMSDQIIILKAQNDAGCDALLLTMRHHPANVPMLLAFISRFPSPGMMIQEKNKSGWNVLMCAARYHPTTLSELLETIEKIAPDTPINLQKNYDTLGQNALMIAAKFQPRSLKPLLTNIECFDNDTQENLHLKTDNEGFNALMNTARHQPLAVTILLEHITKFTIETQIKILQQTNIEGLNALMLAIIYEPEAAFPLLDHIATFDRTTQTALMETSSKTGMTALMLAAEYQPIIIPYLLKMISQFPINKQIELIKAKNSDQINVLTFAMKYKPTAVHFFLKKIAVFPLGQQYLILKEVPLLATHSLEIAEFKGTLISKAVAKLNNTDPLDKALKTILKPLSSAQPYQVCLILEAYKDLSEQPDEKKTRVLDSLHDKNSALCKAFTFKANGFFAIRKTDYLNAFQKAIEPTSKVINTVC